MNYKDHSVYQYADINTALDGCGYRNVIYVKGEHNGSVWQDYSVSASSSSPGRSSYKNPVTNDEYIVFVSFPIGSSTFQQNLALPFLETNLRDLSNFLDHRVLHRSAFL